MNQLRNLAPNFDLTIDLKSDKNLITKNQISFRNLFVGDNLLNFDVNSLKQFKIDTENIKSHINISDIDKKKNFVVLIKNILKKLEIYGLGEVNKISIIAYYMISGLFRPNKVPKGTTIRYIINFGDSLIFSIRPSIPTDLIVNNKKISDTSQARKAASSYLPKKDYQMDSNYIELFGDKIGFDCWLRIPDGKGTSKKQLKKKLGYKGKKKKRRKAIKRLIGEKNGYEGLVLVIDLISVREEKKKVKKNNLNLDIKTDDILKGVSKKNNIDRVIEKVQKRVVKVVQRDSEKIRKAYKNDLTDSDEDEDVDDEVEAISVPFNDSKKSTSSDLKNFDSDSDSDNEVSEMINEISKKSIVKHMDISDSDSDSDDDNTLDVLDLISGKRTELSEGNGSQKRILKKT